MDFIPVSSILCVHYSSYSSVMTTWRTATSFSWSFPTFSLRGPNWTEPWERGWKNHTRRQLVKIITFCYVATSSGVACSSIAYQEILKDLTHHRFLDDCADIVLCCGSNKSIELFDMNAARSVRVVLDAHTRPAHTICQNEVSKALVQFGSSLCHSLLHDDRTWQSVSQNRTSNARAVWAACVTTWRCVVTTWT